MLEIHDLHKSYDDVVALRGIDLSVARGEIVALLGPNGAGKTTLVSIVAGLRKADSGTVTVGGEDAIARPQAVRSLIGLAPQDLGMYPIVTARQNLQLFGELANLRGKDLRTRIDDVAEALQITDLLDRIAGTLSGGQKRRLHTAIALLHKPPLLLLDEATVGADVETRGDLLRLVRQLADEGSAVLYSTHYLHEVAELTASVALMEQGSILARGEERALIAEHSHAAIELTFEGEAPVIHGAAMVDSTIRIFTDDPARSLPATLNQLGSAVDRLVGVEFVRPSLESVYLALTGKRYQAEGGPAPGDLQSEVVA